MSLLWNIGIIAAIIFVLVTAFRVAKQKVSGDNWKQKGASIGIILVSSLALVGIVRAVWPFFSNLVEISVKGGLGGYPVLSVIILSGLCLIGIWSASLLINDSLEKAWGDKVKNIKLAVKLLAVFLSFLCIFHFSGIVVEYGGKWIWAMRFTVILFFVAIGIPLGRWWINGGQNYLVVFISYAICVFCTGYIASAFGWSTTTNILGSVYSLSFVLVFNALVFWFLVGLTTDHKKSFRRSVGFFFLLPYMVCLLIFSGYMLHLQATGKVTWHELEVSRVATQANQKHEELLRVKAAQDLPELKRRFQEAVKAGDVEAANKYKNLINQEAEDQKEIDRAEINSPGAIKQTLEKVKALNPFDEKEREKVVDISSTQGFKITSQGCLVANLSPGEESSRPFILKEGQRTPWIILPPKNYYLRFTNLQTVIVLEEGKSTVVHPEEHYSMGIVQGGSKKVGFKAPPNNEVKIILNIRRKKGG